MSNDASTRPLLRCDTLALSRGPRLLFEEVSLSLNAGEAIVLRGPNGVGKTSLLRLIAGLTAPDAGEVAVAGHVVRGLCARRRDHILYMGHANQLKDELTARENLIAQLDMDAISPSAEEILHALDAVGLLTRRDVFARRLSQGQKRRITLARLTLSPKPLWLLDEPTNALDADGVALFESILDAHLAAGGAAVLATHLALSIRAPFRELQMQPLSAEASGAQIAKSVVA